MDRYSIDVLLVLPANHFLDMLAASFEKVRECALMKSIKLVAAFLLFLPTMANATTVNYAGTTPYIESIEDFAISGTSADGIYKISFVHGNFDDAYGASTLISSLPFNRPDLQDIILPAVHDLLNASSANDLVGSDTSATIPSTFNDDAFLSPYNLSGSISSRQSVNGKDGSIRPGWRSGGNWGISSRTSTDASGICSGCTTKFAVFEKTAELPTIPVPGSLAILTPIAVGFGVVAIRRRGR